MAFKLHKPTLADRKQEKKDLEAQLKLQKKAVALTEAQLKMTNKLLSTKKK